MIKKLNSSSGPYVLNQIVLSHNFQIAISLLKTNYLNLFVPISMEAPFGLIIGNIQVWYNNAYRFLYRYPIIFSASNMFVVSGVPSFKELIRGRHFQLMNSVINSKNCIIQSLSGVFWVYHLYGYCGERMYILITPNL